MGSISKSFSSVLIVILAFSSLIVITQALAQTTTSSPIPVPTPSFAGTPPAVPEFTVQLVGPSYNQPTTYSLDPNTGKIVAEIGYTNEYSDLEITIKNQPFTSFNDSQGNPIFLMYNIRIKDHNSTDNWVEPFQASEGYPTVPKGSDSAKTTTGIPIEGGLDVPSTAGTQTDIQVEAMTGYVGRELVENNPLQSPYVFVGYTSGWSNTQTISIPENVPLSNSPVQSSSNSTPTATAAQSVSGVLLLVVTIALVVIALLLTIIAILLYRNKRNPLDNVKP